MVSSWLTPTDSLGYRQYPAAKYWLAAETPIKSWFPLSEVWRTDGSATHYLLNWISAEAEAVRLVFLLAGRLIILPEFVFVMGQCIRCGLKGYLPKMYRVG